MAFRAALRQRPLVPVAAAAATAAALLPRRDAFAEEPLENIPDTSKLARKPIYDDPTPPAQELPPASPPPSSSTSGSVLSSIFGGSSSKAEEPAQTSSPTPTDRLAVQVRSARLALYGYSVEAEKGFNAFMTRSLNLERDFTATVASLAPPPQVNEPVVPGLIYTLVASLAGSIVTRNRGIILRTSVPVAFGLTAAYAALPHTMSNVEDLLGRYEDRYPEVKRVHSQLRERTQHIWETGKAHTGMTIARGEEALSDARKSVEDWVRQGK